MTQRPENKTLIGWDIETVKDRFYSLQLYTEDDVGYWKSFSDASNTPCEGLASCTTKGVHTHYKPLHDGFFTDQDEALGILFNTHEGTMNVATFSEFDTHGITDWLVKKGFEVRITWLGSRFLWAKVMRDNHVWRIIDTMNLFPRKGVEALGETLGIHKLPKPDYLGERAPTADELPYFREYAMRDAEISYKITKRVRDEFGFLRPTLPSMAVRLWRVLFGRDSNRVYTAKQLTPEWMVSAEFNAYHGGRVESFGRGSWLDKVYCYDFRSMYPSVMLGEYPDARLTPHAVPHPEFKDVRDSEGLILCEFTQNSLIPPIGCKAVLPDKFERFVFGNGTFRAWITLAEARYLEDKGYGHIGMIDRAVIWSKRFKPFEEYINLVWSKRKEYRGKDEVLSDFYKLLMNALYGKFGQRNRGLTQRVNASGGLETIIEDDAELRQVTTAENMSKYSSPILAAYTTAYARLKLHDEMMRYGGTDVIYCDTDSIHTLREHPIGEDIGSLELKFGGRVDNATYVRAKAYLLGEIITWKGLPSRATFQGKQINADTIRACLIHGDSRFEVLTSKLLRWREAQKRNMLGRAYSRLEEFKGFSFNEDYKRRYDRHLYGENLLTENTLSRALII